MKSVICNAVIKKYKYLINYHRHKINNEKVALLKIIFLCLKIIFKCVIQLTLIPMKWLSKLIVNDFQLFQLSWCCTSKNTL